MKWMFCAECKVTYRISSLFYTTLSTSKQSYKMKLLWLTKKTFNNWPSYVHKLLQYVVQPATLAAFVRIVVSHLCGCFVLRAYKIVVGCWTPFTSIINVELLAYCVSRVITFKLSYTKVHGPTYTQKYFGKHMYTPNERAGFASLLWGKKCIDWCLFY